MCNSSQGLSCPSTCHFRVRAFLEKSELTLNKRHVIPPAPTICRISRRVDPGGGAEVVGEVRLIIGAAAQGQLRPGHVHARVERPRRRLKAMDAAPGLWAYTHL